MPKISQKIIDSVFFLYATKDDLRNGINPGGTGFVVSYTFKESGEHFTQLYGVTNWHVACRDGYSIVSLNKTAGGVDPIMAGSEDWHFIPSGPDVAVIPLELSSVVHSMNPVSIHNFAEKRDPHGITVGDDVFMLGLLVNHPGKAVNIPSARFGNISMLPDQRATIEQPTKYEGESFIIDVHSRTGFSGSPVFVYRTPFSDLSWSRPVLSGRAEIGGIDSGAFCTTAEVDFHLPNTLFQLLGIHWAQFPESWELHYPAAITESDGSLVPLSAHWQGFSGMTCVIPAWEILEVLEMPKLKKLRLEKAEALRKQRGHAEPPVPESSHQTTQANPEHKRDFNRLLDAAVTKKPSGH